MILTIATIEAAATTLILGGLGWFALSLIQRGLDKEGSDCPFLVLFASLVSGILIVVFAFSVIRSGGNSSNWAMLLPAVAAVWAWPVRRKVGPPPFQASLRALCFLGLALLASAAWFAPRTMSCCGLSLRPLPRDDAFYVSVIEALLDRGVETTDSLAALLPGMVVKPSVYHYFELWLGAAISWFWATPPILALRLQADVVLLVATMLGLAALLVRLRGTGPRILAAALLLPFLAWWLPSALTDGHLFREALNWQAILPIGGPPKLLPGYVMGLAAALAICSRNPSLAIAAGALATCTNVSFAPMLLGLFVVGAWKLWSSGRQTLKDFAPLLLSAAGPVAFLAFFQVQGGTPTSFAAGPLDDFGWSDLRVSRNIALKSTLYAGFFFGLPALVALGGRGILGRLKATIGWPAAAVLLTYSAGLGIWAVLHRWIDSVQFFMNPVVVVGNIACIVLFGLRPLYGRLRIVMVGAGLLAAANLGNAVRTITAPTGRDGAYLTALQALPVFEPRVGALIISAEAAKSRPSWELHPGIMTPRSLTVARCCVGATPLVDLGSLVAGTPQLKALWENALFVRFAKEGKHDLSDQRGLEATQLAFAVRHQLRFVVIDEKTDVPGWVSTYGEPPYVDTISGERLYVVRLPSAR